MSRGVTWRKLVIATRILRLRWVATGIVGAAVAASAIKAGWLAGHGHLARALGLAVLALALVASYRWCMPARPDGRYR